MTNEPEFQLSPALGIPVRRSGQLVAQGGAFALRQRGGKTIWLEIHPVPADLVGQTVEIVGKQTEPNILWVQAIRPLTSSEYP